MFRQKTLLIVGAGASKEVGLPIGAELAKEISDLLYFEFDFGRLKRGDGSFLDGLRRHFQNNDIVNEHLTAARRISEGVRLVNSIDNYIDSHREDKCVASCGKAAITYSILRAERSSRLFVDPNQRRNELDFDRLEETWLVPFGRYLVQEIPASEIDSVFSNLTIICFNYDRCIEEFLSRWLERIYHLEGPRSRELVANLNIIRPYGVVGPFAQSAQSNSVAFGRVPSDFDFVGASSGLLTYTEQIEDEEVLGNMRGAVAEAETIIFLGFAFHPQNMKLLAPNTKTNALRVLASAYGFSDADKSEISDELLQLFLNGDRTKTRRSQLEPAIHVRNNLKCHELLSEYSRAIAPARPN